MIKRDHTPSMMVGNRRDAIVILLSMNAKRLGIGVIIIILAVLGWYLGSPLFFDTVVDEELPPSASKLTEDEKMMVEEMESLTLEEVEAMPEVERMEKKEMMEELGQKMPDTVADEPMTSEPAVALSGAFQDADSFHQGSGKATIYALPDGKNILRFEDFMVTNGPALSVYLVHSTDGNVDSGFLDLGTLKGNKGNQNYAIPAGTDLSSYGSVVIRCVPFRVTFATASLR